MRLDRSGKQYSTTLPSTCAWWIVNDISECNAMKRRELSQDKEGLQGRVKKPVDYLARKKLETIQ